MDYVGRMRWSVLPLMLVACVRSNVVECDNGIVCPSDRACDAVHRECVLPGQLTACDGKERGDACDIVATADGICDASVCVVARCGDGYRRGDEACDGDDIPEGVTCLSRDFYFTGAITCNNACGVDDSACTGWCGDGIVTPEHEVCEPTIAPTLSCVDFGYGAGVLDCNMCAPGLDDCRRFGWETTALAFKPTDIHGTSDTNVFVIGGTRSAHFDGMTWAPFDLTSCLGTTSPPQMYSVWAFGPGEAIAGGELGTVIHLTRTGCTKLPSATDYVQDIWATSTSNVLAIASDGVRRYDGSTWSLVLAGSYNAIWGSHATNVFVADSTNNIIRYTGSWLPAEPIAAMTSIDAVWGASATDVYASGKDASNEGYVAHFDGVSWSPSFERGALLDGSGSRIVRGAAGGSTTVAIGFSYVGFAGAVPFTLVGDGTGWRKVTPPAVGLATAWVSPSGIVYAIASESTHVATLSQVRFESPSVAPDGAGMRLAALGSSDVFAGGALVGNTHRWNGLSWSVSSSSPIIAGVGPKGHVYGIAVQGGQGMFAYNPATASWSIVGAVGTGKEIAVVDTLQVWWVSTDGELRRWNGSHSYTAHPLSDRNGNAATIGDVWAASATSVFAVGSAGTIQRWNGTSWGEHLPPTTADLTGVWGRTPDDVYAWGGSTLLHFNGTSWTPLPFPAMTTALGLWAGSTSDVFVVTAERGLLRYNGARWAPVNVGTTIPLIDIVGIGTSIFVSDQVGGVYQVLRTATW